MIGYILLGAWLLTLVILGFIVVSTGIPEEKDKFDSTPLFIISVKLIYLVVLAGTFYVMGEHFGNL